jgi:hypothetical protein
MDVGMAEAGQFVTSPCTEKKKDALIRTFWHRSWPMGISPWQMDVDQLTGRHQGRMDDF